tara:strand:+ start:14 stop:310 length:297 start_codon:yes stop_codon:yes gene_type:complete
MKIFNAMMATVFIGIPAGLWWVDWFNSGETPRDKYENTMVNLGLQNLTEDFKDHNDLIEAFNSNKISRNEYVKEMEKLKRKLEREARQTERKVKKELK